MSTEVNLTQIDREAGQPDTAKLHEAAGDENSDADGQPIGYAEDIATLKQQNQELFSMVTALKEQVEQANGFDVAKTKSEGEVTTQQQFLDAATKDDRCGDMLKALRLFCLLAFVCVYFMYEYSLYADPQYNKLSQSAIERIDYIDMPYFYVFGGGQLSNMSMVEVLIETGNGNLTRFELDHQLYDAQHPFSYSDSITNWTAIDYLGADGAEIFIVPPYGLKLNVGSSLRLLIECYAYNVWNVDDDTDYDYRPEVLQKYSNGQSFGIRWDIESVQNIENIDLQAVQEKYLNSWERLKYTFVATVNYYFVDVFEEVNRLSNVNKTYYTTSFIGSILNEEQYTAYWRMSNDSDVWWYWTELNLYPNPSGGGLKTTLTISQRTSLTNVLGNVGGLFSPINTVSFLVLTW
eukprot:CAMPEP_0197030678 /NCGR_PEP_ID=MMETSP1384-20130603/9854_1 /TAXON_ID=29189 /ORGANISM="Ammonia sp." /LENGTH=405 /DNA_ID=CAMNT_0042460071 /DNA_START=67 /DNA_END=1281 /DNA_ORIENTATION=-